MHSRRALLKRGALIGVAASTVGIAGCLEQEGAEEVEQALDLLDENNEMLEDYDDFEDDLPSDPELDGFETRIDEAEAELDQADAVAEDEDIRDAIELGYGLVALQRDLHALMEAWVHLDATFETFDAHMAHEQNEEALEAVKDMEQYAGEANDAVSDAKDSLEALDHDELDATEQVELDVTAAEFDEFDQELDVMEEIIGGLERMVTGLIALEDGLDALEDEDFDAANEHVDEAETEFAVVSADFEELRDDPDLPAHMEGDIVDLAADADSLHAGIEHFSDAVAAAERGDWAEAEDHIDAMEEEL